MYCTKCGQFIKDGTAFCTKCGATMLPEKTRGVIQNEEKTQGVSQIQEQTQGIRQTQEPKPVAELSDESKTPSFEAVRKTELESVQAEIRNIWQDWQVVSKIGEGSFGKVYKAQREELGTVFYSAIKIIRVPQDDSQADSVRSEIGLDKEATTAYFKGFVDDCVNEIKLMESLKGTANIVSVEDYKVVSKVGETGWSIYIRMELLKSFSAFSALTPMLEKDIIKLGVDICSALEYCAKRNVMHRDIKPENIFVSDFGDYKLGDFGIARKLEANTVGMSKKGTYNYMAPEIYNGETSYDAKSDIYSLGIVLYKLLNNNRLPFLDPDEKSISYQNIQSAFDRRIQGEPLPKPKNADPCLAEVILKACAHQPDKRFPSAAAFKEALQNAENGIPLPIEEGVAVGSQVVEKKPVSVEKTDKPSTSASNQKKMNEASKSKKKKMTKGKKILLIISAILVCLAITAGVLVLKWYTSPEQQVLRALETEDYDKALEIIRQNESAGESDALAEKLRSRLLAIKQGFIDNTTTYSVAGMELEAIDKLKVSSVTSELSEVRSFVERINSSRTHFNTAESYMANSEYSEAIAEYQLVDEEDTNYTTAITRLSEATDQYRTDVLAQAASYAEQQLYPEAIDALYVALFTLPDDAELTQQQTIYQNAYVEKTKQDTLDQAAAEAKQGDYPEAIGLLEELITSVGEDAQLTAAHRKYCSEYEKNILAQVDALMSEDDYTGAAALISEALRTLTDSEKLKEKKAKIEESKPASITKLTPINGSWNWNEGNPVDPFGNDYSRACNFAIFRISDDQTAIEYRLYGDYGRITGMLAPYTSIDKDGKACLKIYADDVLMYTSQTITRKTDAFRFELDVSGAEYLRLEICGFTDIYKGNAVILSDVQLWPN